MRRIVSTLFIAACLAAQSMEPIRIEINASRAVQRIPRTIFGTFLEPIGNSIYPGLWSQLLLNPSFEDNLWNTQAVRRMTDENPALHRASQLGLPLPWEPLDAAQGARYEPRWNDAANSHRSLLVMALPDKETGVRQEVYLPVHRELAYRGSLYAKHVSGPARMEVSIRRRNHAETVLAKSDIALVGSGWRKYAFTLEVQRGQLARLEPADFVIALGDESRALIDQATLFPSDAVEGLDPEMVELTRELKTPLIRFGGNYTSAYHWRDGTGDPDKRVSMLNLAWGMPEYNSFGTDEFLAYCRLVGAEPQICLNLGSGTPQEAAEWIRYVNAKWNNGGSSKSRSD